MAEGGSGEAGGVFHCTARGDEGLEYLDCEGDGCDEVEHPDWGQNLEEQQDEVIQKSPATLFRFLGTQVSLELIFRSRGVGGGVGKKKKNNNKHHENA